jgi:hypothetical protein
MVMLLLCLMTNMLVLMLAVELMMIMTTTLIHFCRYVTPILDKLRAGECCKQPGSGVQTVDALGNPISPQQIVQQRQQQQQQQLDEDVAAEASRINARNGNLTDILELHRLHHMTFAHNLFPRFVLQPSNTPPLAASPKFTLQPLKSPKKLP